MAKRIKKRKNRPAQRAAQKLAQRELRSTLPADASQIPEDKEQTTKRAALSGWPMILGWMAMLIFTIHACTHMVAAGDTWVAMACGRHFVNHGVDTIEPFSANSHKPGPTEQEVRTWPNWAQWITSKVGLDTVKKWHPTGWVNQNWLTHVIFYSLIPKSSYADGVSFPSNALVYWKFAIYIITVICVFYTGIILGVNPALSAVFSCFAMFIGRSFLDVRPAGFSNMLVAVFLLILVLATYRNILYIWLIVPVTVFWCNVHGGYIYVFIMLIPFIGLHLMTALPKIWTAILYNITAWPFVIVLARKTGPTFATLLFIVLVAILDVLTIFFKKNLVSVKPRGVCHLIGAYIASFFAAVIFNPFHLTNLTHTFVISVSEHAKRWRDIHEWHPAFEWTNPVGTAVPFAVMYGIALAVLVTWIIVVITTSGSAGRIRKRRPPDHQLYQSPRIDLPLVLIAAMTMYMAIRSRRFIPIAAIAACPIIALLTDQIIRAISATLYLHEHNRLTVPPMTKTVRGVCIFLGALAVVFFGTWWGRRFKVVYLDPWPNDPKLNSVFMRMTASDAKPFYAMKFIKDNKLKGKMFNYWTEGGAIAFGQEPDPNTGHTPLQLFMDGRAQAAYDRPAFDRWTVITSGGPTIHRAAETARLQNKRIEQVLTTKDYTDIGQWIAAQLRKYDVWVALMPAGQFSKPFTRGLEHNREWPVVFMNNKQKVFVDITTPQGKLLYQGIFTGQTRYPDQYHKDLMLGHNYLLQPDKNTRKRGFDLIKAAFNANPSPAPMLQAILFAARSPDLIPLVTEFCSEWVAEFTDNKKTYLARDGYRLRLEATRLATVHLQKVARTEKKQPAKLAELLRKYPQADADGNRLLSDAELADFYRTQMEQYVLERNRISQSKRW